MTERLAGASTQRVSDFIAIYDTLDDTEQDAIYDLLRHRLECRQVEPPPMPLVLTCNCDECCARRKARREWAEKNGTA